MSLDKIGLRPCGSAFIEKVANPSDPDHSHLAMLRDVRAQRAYNLSAVGCYITSTVMALSVLGVADLTPSEVYAILEESDAQGSRGI